MVQNTPRIGLSSGSLRLASQAETPQSHPFPMMEEQLWHEGIDFWEGQQPMSGGMAGSDVLQAPWLWPSSPPVQAVQALGTQLLGGSHHGYWEEEAIWVEIKVSMTPWLDGSRWLCPLESELWYNTRLLEDTAEANKVTSCLAKSPPTPSPTAHLLGMLQEEKAEPHTLNQQIPATHPPSTLRDYREAPRCIRVPALLGRVKH